MATFDLVHGAFVGGWSWRWLAPYLRGTGHEVHSPTLTGHGERAHLASPQIDLDTHIEDVVHLLHYEDLTGAILVGYSYGGMVVAGVADRVPSGSRTSSTSTPTCHRTGTRVASRQAGRRCGKSWPVPTATGDASRPRPLV